MSGAQWRCSECGRYVPGERVRMRDGDFVPVTDCPTSTCGDAVVAHFEPVAARGSREPADRRVVGQDVSLLSLPDVARESFLSVIRKEEEGARVSVNTLRSRLDRLEVPASSRGGLFALAVRQGLLEPVWVDDGTGRYPARDVSTNELSNASSVKLYRRTARR